jgi:radical SAM superfamily enzyme YgiQ (UPF0313 family)
MARVFLLNPPTDEPVRSPLLSFLYLAASLRRVGHEVALLDASAPHAPKEHAAIADRVRGFAPALVGIHCKTLYVHDSYGLARGLREHGVTAPLVCGGPHPTVVPLEPLAHGFDFSIRGEAEETLCELAAALDGRGDAGAIRGLVYRDATGAVRLGAPRAFILDLDALALPIDALDLFDPAWYGCAATVPPSGLLSSRGCPAACTFCSNDVTGRRFRYRKASLVREEVEAMHARAGLRSFTFFDDSFAVGKRRVDELCAQLAQVRPRLSWTATCHPSHLTRDVLLAMKQAGCGGVDIGMESGAPDQLLRIGKGVTVERVLEVLELARAVGLHCMLNLMFGWPDETPGELQTTVDFIERSAPLAAAFNARGVLVPYPGTEVYQQHHRAYGFTDWWLRAPLRYAPFPAAWSREEVERAYADDAALARNFFQLPPAALELIQRGLGAKARHTFEKVAGAQRRAEPPRVAAAGAR